MRKHLLLVAAVGVAAAGLAGCPSLAPFDVTGAYAGTWEMVQMSEEKDACPITFTLAQDASGLQVTGTVEMRVGCFGDFFQGLEDAGLLAPITLNVEGTLAPEGTLILATPELLDECTENLCLKAVFTGKGEDADGDGAMDTWSGNWVGAMAFGQLPTQTVEALGGIPAALPSGGSFTVTAQ